MRDEMMMGEQKRVVKVTKRRDDWMGAMTYREVFSHPFLTPLFKF
jgi:hypothetical protein